MSKLKLCVRNPGAAGRSCSVQPSGEHLCSSGTHGEDQQEPFQSSSQCLFFFFLNSSSRTLSSFRFVASFAYYGSVLSSSELLEKNLLCVIDPDEEHSVKHRHEDSLCYCIPFAQSDYQTLMISCLGEFGCKLMCHLTSRAPPPGQRSHLLNRVCLNLRMTTCPAPPPMSLQ